MASRSIKAFIGRREGLVMVAYPDGQYYSIGFGHNGPDVAKGDKIGLKAALALFDKDLALFSSRLNKRLLIALLPHEKDALLSSAYNLGVAGVMSVVELLNPGHRLAAMDELEKLCKVRIPDDGDPDTPPVQFVESAGLKKRRLAERKLFETGDYGDISRIPYWDGNPFKTPMRWMAFPEAVQ